METRNTDNISCLEECLNDNHTRKLLPCFHVFCVEYLREFNKTKPREGKQCNKSRIACPRCRAKVEVPDRDLDNLLDNFFGRRLEILNRISLDGRIKADTGGEAKLVCDICIVRDRGNGTDEGMGMGVSVAHCLDCRQNLCETCLGCHSRMRLSRTHQVLGTLAYTGSVTELLSNRERPCETHPSELERVFCEVCEVPMCTKCSAEEWHRGHRFVPVSRISETSRTWIVDKLDRLKDAKNRAIQLLESVETERKRFVENVEDVKMEINEMTQRMMEDISNVSRNLREELNDHREKQTSETLTLDKEVRRKCDEFEQLVGSTRQIYHLVPDCAAPQYAENLSQIAMLLAKAPEFHEEEESWLRSPPRADHFLSIVNQSMNDDVDVVTEDMGELKLQRKQF